MPKCAKGHHLFTSAPSVGGQGRPVFKHLIMEMDTLSLE